MTLVGQIRALFAFGRLSRVGLVAAMLVACALLAIAATPLAARAASITGAWRRPGRASLWLRLTYGTRTPGESIAREQLGLAGSRSSWSVMIWSSAGQ